MRRPDASPSTTQCSHLPRFTGENRERNQRLIETLHTLATEKSISASQLAVAWVLSKSNTIVPLIDAQTRTQLAESLRALQVELLPADVARIEEAIPASAVAGTGTMSTDANPGQRTVAKSLA